MQLPTNQEPLQFLTFLVGEEEYGVEITQVREVKGWTTANSLPEMPAYMRGVLNLRGAMIPVFDVRARFSHHLTEATSKHVVIIVALEEKMVGLLIDSVSDIMSIHPQDIKPSPTTSHIMDKQYVRGLVAQEDRMVVLLDTAQLLSQGLMEQMAMGVNG